MKDPWATSDDRFRIEEQKSVVATGTAGRDPKRSFWGTQSVDVRSPAHIARSDGCAHPPAADPLVATYSGEGSLALSRAQNEHTLDRTTIATALAVGYILRPPSELAAEQTEVKTLVESTRGHILMG
jgi:hypothetical protein